MRFLVDSPRRLRMAMALLAGACCLFSARGEPPEQMDFADGLFSRGLYDMAATEYTTLIDARPAFEGRDAALFRLAECHRNLGSKVAAERVYHQLMSEFPESRFRFRGEFRRAELFLAARQYDKAARLFTELIDRNPPEDITASTRYFLGYTREKQEMDAEAAAAYRTVVNDHPDTTYVSYACLALAQLLERTGGSTNEIQSLYAQAGRDSATPRVAAEALFRQGDAAYRAGDFVRSAEAYRELLSGYPDDRRAAEARLQAAWSYYHAGQHRPAQAMAARTLVGLTGAGRFDWLYLLANCQRMSGDAAAALTTYESLISQFPNVEMASSVAYERLLILFEQENYSQVFELGRSVRPPPDVAEDHHWLLAESAIKLDRHSDAMIWLGRIIEAFPGRPRTPLAVFRRARLLQDAGTLDEAAEGYLSIVDADATSALAPDALFAAAYCRLSAGAYLKAIPILKRLLTDFPAFAQREDAAYQKALAELKLEDDAAAMTSLELLLREFPESRYAPEAAYWSGVLAERVGQDNAAETYFRAAMAKQQNNLFRERAMFRLSAVLQKQDEEGEAAGLLLNLLGSSMQSEMSPALLEWLSRYLLANQKPAEAGRAARVLIQQGGSPVWRQIAHFLAGEAAAATGDTAAAMRAYRSAVEESASTRDGVLAALALGDLSLAAEAHDDAERFFSRAAALAKDPDMIDVRARSYFGLGMAARGRQDWDEASRRFMSVGILFDDETLTPEALYRASKAFAKIGRDADRERTARELQERYPDSEWTTTLLEE